MGLTTSSSFMGLTTSSIMGLMTSSVVGLMTSSIMGCSVLRHTTNIMGLMTNGNLQITKYQFKAGKGVVIPSASHGTAVEAKRVFQGTT
jgi:hypothetical protein